LINRDHHLGWSVMQKRDLCIYANFESLPANRNDQRGPVAYSGACE
jgi:hypothetical protein